MKIVESEKMVLVRCIIYFDDIQVSLTLFSLSLNSCKVMMVFFKFRPENIKKASITIKKASISILLTCALPP